MVCMTENLFHILRQEINEMASQIKDPSFRIMVSEEGVHVFNRDGLQVGVDPLIFMWDWVWITMPRMRFTWV
jgi:hypothetical protein